MIDQRVPPCALGLDGATLSALRDEALPPAELRRLREHAAGCAACQARIAGFDRVAQALRRQLELEPGDRVWLGVQERAMKTTTSRGPRRGGASFAALSPSTWRGLAAVASLALVVGLLAAVLATGAGNRTGAAGQPTQVAAKPTQPVATDIGKPTFAPTATSAYPTATLPPTSPAITAAQAWGANAAMMTFNTQLDASHVFSASAISPDGRYLLGYRMPAQPTGGDQAESGYYDLITRQFTAIGITQSWNYPPRCCQTDGRYLLATLDTAPGTTCGLCHLTYYAYDLNSKTLWQIADGRNAYILGVAIDHGFAVLDMGNMVTVLNLATHATTQVQLHASDPAQAVLLTYTWPYLIYNVPQPGGAPGTVMLRVYNLSTHVDSALAHLDNLQARDGVGAALAGDTLFVTQGVFDDPRTNAAETSLYEDDSFFSSSAAPHLLASYASGLWAAAADSRLVNLYAGMVWDRSEQRFVQVIASVDPNSSWQFGTSLAGRFLAIIQPANPSGNSFAQQVAIYDTGALSTAPSG